MGRAATRGIPVLLGLALAASLVGCGSGSSATGGGRSDRLKIGAYSVVREAFHDGLLPAFAARWKEKTGRGVTFEESYNASGAQARSIQAGFDADIAALSLEGDMDQLVRAGLVKSGWDAGPNKGMLTHSLVVIGYREGNPKGIKTWDDLARPGVGVLYPDPKTSGGAKWNVAAIYGAALLASRAAGGGKADTEAARSLLARVQSNVVNMDPSGRQSMATFERGTGDAVVTYENELLLRKREGRAIRYAIPEATLRIESPVALVDTNVDRHGTREVAGAFLEFALGPEGQKILADYGFRPVNPEVADDAKPPLPKGVFTIADLGGWSSVNKDVFGPGGLWTSVFTGLRGK